MSYLNEEYHDRGKKKWAGFYLSEHSSEQEKQRETWNKINEPKEKLNLLEIGKILEQARLKNKVVAIQKEAVDSEGDYYDDIVGLIMGADELGIFIGDQKVDYDEIRHVRIVECTKWNDL